MRTTQTKSGSYFALRILPYALLAVLLHSSCSIGDLLPDPVEDSPSVTHPSSIEDECDRDADWQLANTAECGGLDCDDNDSSIHPGAIEICGDSIDQDCDGSDTPAEVSDNDGDGYTPGDNDCNDDDPAINPAATEIRYNGIDEDCQLYLTPDDDIDGDGYCVHPENWLHSEEHPEYANVCEFTEFAGELLVDCDDYNDNVNPGATDAAGNNIDEDCSGAPY